jgi:glycosyltransferase involved in cell wall biosynthesis
MKLSIFSIVKNEEEMFEDALKSMEGADEIVVVDTGSTDKTIELAKKYTDKIYTDYKWNDNFAEAKNYALSKCTGDWIIGLDADCRFEPGAVDKIRKIIENAKEDEKVFNVKLKPNTFDTEKYHLLPKLFRNLPEIKYVGKVHEYVVGGEGIGDGDVTICYLYSPNHKKDPDRNLRILLKSVEEEPKNSRWKFYLAREYFDKKDFVKSIWWFNEYLKIATWQPEISEAYIMLAKCYWYLNMGDDARMMCMHAIRFNPDFKEALKFMGDMHYSPRKEMWHNLASVAKNKGVLFVR